MIFALIIYLQMLWNQVFTFCRQYYRIEQGKQGTSLPTAQHCGSVGRNLSIYSGTGLFICVLFLQYGGSRDSQYNEDVCLLLQIT